MKSAAMKHWLIDCPILVRRGQRNNLSRERLAEECGLSADTIQQIELGNRRNPGMHTVGAIAHALGVSGSKLHFELAMWMNNRPKETEDGNGTTDSGS